MRTLEESGLSITNMVWTAAMRDGLALKSQTGKMAHARGSGAARDMVSQVCEQPKFLEDGHVLPSLRR